MEKIPKMRGALRGKCCEICRNIPQKHEGVYQGVFFNKTSAATSYR